MLDKIFHHYYQSIWVTEKLLLVTSHLGLHCLHMRALSWVLMYSLSRMLEREQLRYKRIVSKRRFFYVPITYRSEPD